MAGERSLVVRSIVCCSDMTLLVRSWMELEVNSCWLLSRSAREALKLALSAKPADQTPTTTRRRILHNYELATIVTALTQRRIKS